MKNIIDEFMISRKNLITIGSIMIANQKKKNLKRQQKNLMWTSIFMMKR